MSDRKVINLFKEKYKLNISFEPTVKSDDYEQYLVEELHSKVVLSDKVAPSVIEELKKVISRGTTSPTMYNFLYVSYVKNGNKKEADQILKDTLKMFPDYFFAKTQLLTNDILDGKLDDVKLILGEDVSIKDLFPQNVYHVSEIFTFYQTKFNLAVADKNLSSAKNNLRTLWDLGEKYAYRIKKFVKLYNSLEFESIKRFEHTYMEANFVEIENKKSAPDVDLVLFKKITNTDFCRKDIEDILNGPLDVLLPKLLNISEFCLLCFDELDYEDSAIFINAFGFLSIYKFEPAYPLFLKYLSKENDFIEFWLEDSFEWVGYIAYQFGLIDHRPLIEFLQKQHVNDDVRAQVGEALVQLALRNPSCREDVIDAFRKVLQLNLDNIEDKKSVATYFLMFFISDLLLLNERSLVEMAKPFFDHNLIDLTFNGDYENHLNELKKWEYKYAFKHQPQDIYEYFGRDFEIRNESKPLSEVERKDFVEIVKPSDPFEIFMKDSFISSVMEVSDNYDRKYGDSFDDYDEHFEGDDLLKNITRNELKLVHNKLTTDKKIGRNDPCPCGSGKKFKKCCINKEIFR